MSVAVRRPMSIEEFLAWEEGQELRWEFDGFAPVARVAGSIRCPDAFVVCTPVPRAATVVEDPVVVFEVLCPGTASVDHFVKNREYRDTPSIRRYVMLEQDFVGATMFERSGDDWVGHVLGAEAVLDMPEIGIQAPLAELYEGLALEPDANAG